MDLNANPNNGMKKRILIVAGGGLLLILLISVFIAVIFSEEDINANLVRIAQRQEEIVRIAERGSESARDNQLNSLATTTRAAIASSQNQTVNRLAQNEISLNSSQLELRQDETTTQELRSAEEANRFDEVFIEVFVAEISEYRADVEQTYEIATLTADRELLEALYNEATLLLNTLQ